MSGLREFYSLFDRVASLSNMQFLLLRKFVNLTETPR